MPTAAYCVACGIRVWVSEDGRCPNGHGPEHLSGHYEASYEAAPARPVVSPRRRRPAYFWLALVAAGLFAMILVASQVLPAFFAFRSAQAVAACNVRQADIETAITAFRSGTGANPSTLEDLVPAFLPTRPNCTSGGSYVLSPDGSAVSCTVHGSCQTRPAASTGST